MKNKNGIRGLRCDCHVFVRACPGLEHSELLVGIADDKAGCCGAGDQKMRERYYQEQRKKPAHITPGFCDAIHPISSRLSEFNYWGEVRRVYATNGKNGESPCKAENRLNAGRNGIAHANLSRTDDFGNHALARILHQFTKTGADGVHLFARDPRFIQKQNRFANLNFLSDKRNEINSQRFDVRPHGARRNSLQSERHRMFRDLLALHQSDLPTTWRAGAAADFAEVSWFAGDSFSYDEFDFIRRLQ